MGAGASPGTRNIPGALLNTANLPADIKTYLGLTSPAPYAIEDISYAAMTTVARSSGTLTTILAGAAQSGWAQIFSSWVGMSFNAVRVPEIYCDAVSSALAPAVVTVEVRQAGPTGTLVASGSLAVDRAKVRNGDVVVLLGATVDQAAVAGGNFSVAYTVKTAAGGNALCRRVEGITLNQTAGSYYYSGSIWIAVTGNPFVAFDLLSLTTAVKTQQWVETPLPRLKGQRPGFMAYPPTLWAVQGTEINIYWDNLLPCDRSLVDVGAACTVGTNQTERWTYTPSGAATATLTIDALDPLFGEAIDTATVSVVAVASNARAGQSESVLMIGDSLTNAGVITQTLLDKSAADTGGLTVTCVGTQGVAPNKHEGRSGWSVTTYFTQGTSPFMFTGVFNFAQYLTANSLATPGRVIIMLGTNDVFSDSITGNGGAKAAEAAAQIENMIASIKAAGVAKVTLCMPPCPARSEDAFGASYGSTYTRAKFKRAVADWTRVMKRQFGSRTASGIYFCMPGLSLDTTNNMQVAAATAVNARNSTTVVRQSNGVHPAASGYQQIGDALWAHLKGT